jgi:hypothetical protein
MGRSRLRCTARCDGSACRSLYTYAPARHRWPMSQCHAIARQAQVSLQPLCLSVSPGRLLALRPTFDGALEGFELRTASGYLIGPADSTASTLQLRLEESAITTHSPASLITEMEPREPTFSASGTLVGGWGLAIGWSAEKLSTAKSSCKCLSSRHLPV